MCAFKILCGDTASSTKKWRESLKIFFSLGEEKIRFLVMILKIIVKAALFT